MVELQLCPRKRCAFKNEARARNHLREFWVGVEGISFSTLRPLYQSRNRCKLIATSYGKFRKELRPLVPSAQSITAKTHPARFSDSNHSTLLRTPTVNQAHNFPPPTEQLLYRTVSRMIAFLNTAI